MISRRRRPAVTGLERHWHTDYWMTHSHLNTVLYVHRKYSKYFQVLLLYFFYKMFFASASSFVIMKYSKILNIYKLKIIIGLFSSTESILSLISTIYSDNKFIIWDILKKRWQRCAGSRFLNVGIFIFFIYMIVKYMSLVSNPSRLNQLF